VLTYPLVSTIKTEVKKINEINTITVLILRVSRWAGRVDMQKTLYSLLIPAIVLAVLYAGLPDESFADAGGHVDVVQKVPGGIVNWTRGIVQAEGLWVPEEKNAQEAADRELAFADAVAAARKHLLQAVFSVRMESLRTVGDIAQDNEVVTTEIRKMVLQAPLTKQEFLSDGTVRATLALELQGGFSQLVLPQDIRQIDTILAVSEEKPKEPETSLPKAGPAGEAAFSGLLVDARGLEIRPSLVFRIMDENGQEVYGPAFVSREHAVQKSMARFVTDPDTARRRAQTLMRPLLVKGLRKTGPASTDIVISDADAARLQESSEHIAFLRKCQVLIVVDPLP
jgi:hypothetical protein